MRAVEGVQEAVAMMMEERRRARSEAVEAAREQAQRLAVAATRATGRRAVVREAGSRAARPR